MPRTYPKRNVAAAVAAGTVVVLYVAMGAGDPSFAWGAGVGAWGLILILGLILLAVLGSVALWLFLFKGEHWSLLRCLAYAGFVFVTSLYLNLGLILVLDWNGAIGKSITTAKWRHYCLQRYEPMACAEQIIVCPTCGENLSPEEREAIAENLRRRPLPGPESAK